MLVAGSIATESGKRKLQAGLNLKTRIKGHAMKIIDSQRRETLKEARAYIRQWGGYTRLIGVSVWATND